MLNSRRELLQLSAASALIYWNRYLVINQAIADDTICNQFTGDSNCVIIGSGAPPGGGVNAPSVSGTDNSSNTAINTAPDTPDSDVSSLNLPLQLQLNPEVVGMVVIDGWVLNGESYIRQLSAPIPW